MRNCQGWRDCGLRLTTTSDEACKLFDAALQQLTDKKVGPYGTVEKILEDMHAADPEFVMGNVLVFALTLGATDMNRKSEPIRSQLTHLRKLIDKQCSVLTEREKKHAQAVIYVAKSLLEEACMEWVSILTEHPRDMLALKLLYLWQIYTGRFHEMRDVMSRILPAWTQSDMEYGYLVGMYAFALQETHFYEKGKQKGIQALQMNPRDTWATHTMAHVYLMSGSIDDGAKFMADTTANWEWDAGLACHIHWHHALFYAEKGDFATVLDIYDKEVAKRAVEEKTLFNISDGVSLLYRLKLEGVDAGVERWREMVGLSESHIGDHTQGLYDAHLMLAACSSHRDELATHMLESMTNMIKGEKNFVQQMSASVNLPVCEAIAAFERKDYADAVEHLRPVRYKAEPMGGSAAQRDVFNQLLIHSALRSSRHDHNLFAQQLLLERKALMEDSPLADRLLSRALSSHIE